MKKLLLVLLAFPISWNILSQSSSDYPKIETRSLGNFKITSKNSTQIISIQVEKAIFKKDATHGWNESDLSISIGNSKGMILYKKSYPADQDGQLNILADTISLEGIGTELLVHYVQLPSCGSCGEDVQIFGFNGLGYLVPFTEVIRVFDKFSNNSFFNVKWFKSRDDLISSPSNSGEVNCKECSPYLEFLQFTGFCGFNTLGYSLLEKGGMLETPNFQKFEFSKIPLRVGDGNYSTIDKISQEDNGDEINLYSSPDSLSKFKVMQLKKGMTIRFFEGMKNWIHVRIAGYEGYIIWEEVSKLGFPECG